MLENLAIHGAGWLLLRDDTYVPQTEKRETVIMPGKVLSPELDTPLRVESSRIIKALTEQRPVSSSWIISCLLFGGALGLRLFFGSWLEPNKFLTFYPAVAAAAIIGGWLEGCMVALLSALAAWYFFFEPRYTFGTADKNLVPLLIGFLFVSGFLIWIVALLRDAVRELQHEVAARKQAEASLRQGDRRKDEFLATLAHELRNPLAPIHNVTQVLRKKHGPGDRDAPLLDMVDRQVNHLVHLVDDLLEISRINLDKVELHKERVDLTALLRDAMEASEPLFEKKGHCVTFLG